MIHHPFLKLVIYVAIIEFSLIVVSICCFFLLHIFFDKRKEQEKKRREAFRNSIIKLWENKKSFSSKSFIKNKMNPEHILEEIEHVDINLSGEKWNKLKEEIITTSLLPLAKKWYEKKDWMKRNFSVRCFQLLSRKEDEKYFFRFLKDTIPLIRMIAAKGAVAIGSSKLLKTLFFVMSKERDRGRYAYRDAILSGDISIFSWIREQLKMEKDSAIRSIYLDILSTRYDSYVVPYVIEDLSSSNEKTRWNAVKILSHFPSKEVLSLLLPHLKDSYEMVRAEVIQALPNLMEEEALSYLEESLTDNVWWVRLQAGLVLKKYGDVGRKILEEQSQKTGKIKEVVEYVLSLP